MKAFKQIFLTISDGDQQIILEKDVEAKNSIQMCTQETDSEHRFVTYLTCDAAEDLAKELINLSKEVRND